jgi:predicted nucleic acid-binding protein
MPIVTYDTCIYISRQPSSFPKGFRMTAIVLQELTAGAADDSTVKLWNDARRLHERAGTLLVPDGEDWWMAGKVLNSLLRGLRSTNKGKIPKISAGEKQRIIRDVLIARVAKRSNTAIVTDNVRDLRR